MHQGLNKPGMAGPDISPGGYTPEMGGGFPRIASSGYDNQITFSSIQGSADDSLQPVSSLKALMTL